MSNSEPLLIVSAPTPAHGNRYDIFPTPVRVDATPVKRFQIETNLLPDRFSRRAWEMWQIGQHAEVRRQFFLPGPEQDWMLGFRAGPTAQAQRYINQAYLYMLDRYENKQLPQTRFHPDTGKIANALFWLAKTYSDAVFGPLLRQYRSYMQGESQGTPPTRLAEHSLSRYGLELMVNFTSQRPQPTQDYAILYVAPLDSVVQVFGAEPLSEAVEFVNQYRIA